MIIDSNGDFYLPDDVQQIADIKLAVALIENLKIGEEPEPTMIIS